MIKNNRDITYTSINLMENLKYDFKELKEKRVLVYADDYLKYCGIFLDDRSLGGILLNYQYQIERDLFQYLKERSQNWQKRLNEFLSN